MISSQKPSNNAQADKYKYSFDWCNVFASTICYFLYLKSIELPKVRLLYSILCKPVFKDFAFLVLRVFTGVLLIHHGFEKLNDINNFADAFVRPLHLPFPIALSYLAAGSEIGGSWLLILGLGTRLGAVAILGTMSVAIYHAIATSGFNIYLLELLGLYFSSVFTIILFGPGVFSADYLVTKGLKEKPNFIFSKKLFNNSSSSNQLIAKSFKKSKLFELPLSSFFSS